MKSRSAARVPCLVATSLLVLWITSSQRTKAADAPAQDAAPAAAVSELGMLVTRLATENGHEQALDVVLKHLTIVPRRHSSVAHRLRHTTTLFTDPWSGPVLARDLRDRLLAPFQNPKDVTFDATNDALVDWLDAAVKDLEPEAVAALKAIDDAWAAVSDESVVEGELMNKLSEYCGAVNAALQLALADFSDDERAAMFSQAPPLLDAWFHINDSKPQVTAEHVAALVQMMKLLPRIDRMLLLATARRAMRVADAKFASSFPKRLNKLRLAGKAPAGFSGDVLAIAGDSDANRVVLGGPQRTTYGGRAALVLDLAGNDVYERAAVVDRSDALFSAVIDLRGDDAYTAARPAFGPCAAIGGIAILVDRAGKDAYTSTRFGQGAAIGGYAFQYDAEGNDTYAMEDFGQGCGVYGIGLQYDLAGNDKRDAWAFAQGAALMVGFGACVDDVGDDSYLADLYWPDVYGDSGPDSYHGASQGYATGVRAQEDDKGGLVWNGMAGGVGVLIDRLGKDRYQSGNFSQGGAYYFSFGLMYDGGGDDENFGYRYSQGFGVHQAVGIRWDAGGNDHYVTRCAANLGSAWDEGIGFFLDDAGDDRYEMGSLGLGGAANSAIAILVDGDGKDTYGVGATTDVAQQGGAGDRTYYNEPSLSLLLDLGGKADTYSRGGRKDDILATDGGIALFLDAKKKSLADLLALPKIAP